MGTTLVKDEFKNTTDGYVGVVQVSHRGEPQGVGVRPGESVWLSEEEQILTANAPRNDEDNPLANGALELVTAAKEVINRRPLRPEGDLARDASEAEQRAAQKKAEEAASQAAADAAAAEAKKEKEAEEAAAAKKAADAKKAEEAKKAAEAKKAEETRKAEAAKKAAAEVGTPAAAEQAKETTGSRPAGEETATPEADTK